MAKVNAIFKIIVKRIEFLLKPISFALIRAKPNNPKIIPLAPREIPLGGRNNQEEIEEVIVVESSKDKYLTGFR